MKFNSGVFTAQAVIIAFCAFAVAEQVVNFPYPSPLVRPFLPPKLRWPTEQVMGWVETGQFNDGFARYFARDPDRAVPAGNNLVSASDGIVQRVDFRAGITYLVVGLSFWDVHVVRTPASGIVKSVEPAGTWYAKAPPVSRTPSDVEAMIYLRDKFAPVQEIVTIATEFGEIKVRLITSYWASRLKIWVHPGEKLEKGQRIGRILLGSTVVVELPGKFDLAVKPPQRVVGGESVVGEIPR